MTRETKKSQYVRGLRDKALQGLALLVGRELVIKAVAATGQLLLVRLLTPEFFGVFAVLTFIVNVADLFTDVGLVSGVIREEKTPSSETISLIFTFKMVLTSLAVIGLNTLAPVFMSWFLHTNAFLAAFRVMTLTLLLRPFKTLTYGLLERDLRYERIPLVDVGGLLVYFLVALFFAWLHVGVWSLVWAVVVKDGIELVILYVVRPWQPHIVFSFRKISQFIRFGTPLQLATIVGFIHQSSIPFLGGLLTTPASVGLLDTAYNIASLPRALTDNVGRVAFASFSRLQDEKDILARASMRAMAVLTLPLLLLLVLSLTVGHLVVRIVLTQKWEGVLVPLQWYLVAGIFLACVAVLQQAIIVCGETLWLLKLSSLTVLVEWIVAVVFIRFFGFTSLSIAAAVGAGILFLEYTVLSWRIGLSVSLRQSVLPNFCIFGLTLAAGIGISLASLPQAQTIVILVFGLPIVFGALSWWLAHETVVWVYRFFANTLFGGIINKN